MASTPWYVEVGYQLSTPLSDDAAFDAIEALSDHAAAMSIHTDRKSGSVSATVEARNAKAAAESAATLLASAKEFLGDVEIVQLDVMTEAVRTERNNALSIPALVGYAEIADMAKVSRQRARDIAQREGFPVAVVETAAGPLRVKSAVESWIRTWDRTPGRRSHSPIAT